jgi:hypothetical protein
MYHPFNHPNYNGLQFLADYSVAAQAVILNISRLDPQTGRRQMARIEWDEVPDAGFVPCSTLAMRDQDARGTGVDNEAQFLFDALWEMGLRPAGSEPTTNVLASKDAHLKDLRTILFNNLGIKDE